MKLWLISFDNCAHETFRPVWRQWQGSSNRAIPASRVAPITRALMELIGRERDDTTRAAEIADLVDDLKSLISQVPGATIVEEQ